MERHIVFGHELKQFDVARVFEPGFPLGPGVVGHDTEITDWSVEPDVKD